MELTDEEKKILLTAARNSIRSLFTAVEIEEPDYGKYPELKIHAGAFVTLTEFGKLRGCIGYILSERQLFDTVCEAAVNSAENDPRFQAVREPELKNITIEISILSPPFPLNSYEEIEIGKHGLILEETGRRGLLLPQVPIEHHMNKEQYLDAICQKAGFHPEYWRTKQLQLHAFTADIFSEEVLTDHHKDSSTGSE
ncbi:MAG: AmmeMemoRadiSam system protein A [Ignavibacteriales bacterium]|nr:AmmeMemoRadiSam system protein A [Ignavibacteriales bacterium]